MIFAQHPGSCASAACARRGQRGSRGGNVSSRGEGGAGAVRVRRRGGSVPRARARQVTVWTGTSAEFARCAARSAPTHDSCANAACRGGAEDGRRLREPASASPQTQHARRRACRAGRRPTGKVEWKRSGAGAAGTAGARPGLVGAGDSLERRGGNLGVVRLQLALNHEVGDLRDAAGGEGGAGARRVAGGDGGGELAGGVAEGGGVAVGHEAGGEREGSGGGGGGGAVCGEE